MAWAIRHHRIKLRRGDTAPFTSTANEASRHREENYGIIDKICGDDEILLNKSLDGGSTMTTCGCEALLGEDDCLRRWMRASRYFMLDAPPWPSVSKGKARHRYEPSRPLVPGGGSALSALGGGGGSVGVLPCFTASRSSHKRTHVTMWRRAQRRVTK